MPYEILGDDFLGDDEDELMGDEVDELMGDLYGNDLGFGGGGDDAGMGMMGADDYEILGARGRRGNKLARLARALKLAKRRRLARRGFSRERGLIMGFDRQTIALNTTADFTANPQVPFRPRTMIVAATSIDGLVIEDIKVGKNSQFVTAGAVPAATFSTDATFKDFKFDTAVPGIDVVVTATDVSGAANTVAISMNGVAAER